jgi:hypothetical protein
MTADRRRATAILGVRSLVPRKAAGFKTFKPFKSFKTIPDIFDGLNDLNGLNDSNLAHFCALSRFNAILPATI